MSLVSKILSQGRIVSAKRQLRSPGSDYTATNVNVTPEMLPSFHIVAFHLLPRGVHRDPELVADSIWIDVIDRCVGMLKVGLKNNEFIQTLEPSSQVHLKVTGDAEATVGLVAVDKAVYVLNSKHRLTQKKIWDTVEEHDPGCTVGSGRDRFAMFKGAGLDLKVSTGMYTQQAQIVARRSSYQSRGRSHVGDKSRRPGLGCRTWVYKSHSQPPPSFPEETGDQEECRWA
ncbi:hypothetical protein GHT09_004036 [Marmota monax]|uniref:Alpha-2-macroglobulin bait region domain-containing protein n=1 Tax=Marmota monax TaxID=9995 RepID=A0A834PRY8_MARMO|nr:hypothetical protein GHT09_004036 [Marmota monax]